MLKNGLKSFEKIEAKNVDQDGGWEVREKSGEMRARFRKKDGCSQLVAGKRLADINKL